MRAAFITAHGPAESIQVSDLPMPQPGPGEVRVRVVAAALNPIDLYLRNGVIPMPMAFPYIVGCDLAGTVEAIGSEVSRFKVGDRVWGSNQGLLGRQGTAAEFAVVAEQWLYPIPPSIGDNEAAALALVAITAHLGLFRCGGLQPGESIYVPGGSGGVGSVVIQMARAVGARVATSAGGPEHVALCQQLGADLALDYKQDDIPTGLRDFAGDGLDLWYETQRNPNLEVSVPLLRKRGRIILMAGRDARPILPLGQFYPRDCSIHGFTMFNATPQEQEVCAREINAWTAEGKLRAQIGRIFSLEETPAAQRFLEDNTIGGAGTLTGKVVIRVA